MAQPKEDIKEIQLFGDKSIREEAYRQKILELEKELVQLETLAKNSHTVNLKTETATAKISELYYDSLISFDKRMKKEQEFLERRANEATERLDLTAQRLVLNMELMFKRKTKWLMVSLLITAVLLTALFITTFLFISNRLPDMPASGNKAYIGQKEPLERSTSYLKSALQTETKYQHQYELRYFNLARGSYVGRFELNFLPTDKWYLKSMCADIVNVYRKYAGTMPCELIFSHHGKIYLKAVLTELPQKLIYHFFE